ncbi:MAG: hypothetical protein BWK75_04050 [Candidatus Altiarchaeales archaeon A3]|nr:MAG: hypothetical protein BWK75_04050 [Candidatus Altiarchaeales archaeon A3]
MEQKENRKKDTEKEKILITSALPYVNNIPHIGNIVGSHLPADIFARFMRTLNYDVTFVGGADEHGTPIEIAAQKKNLNPKELCDYYFNIHKKIYEWLNISYDIFSRTSKEIHHSTTQEFFTQIYKNGYIKEGKILLPYCEKCNRVLPDRYVEGTCPHCGYEKARGDQCEMCGNMLNPTELKNPRCAICGSKPEIVERTHLFFELNKLSDQLEEWIKSKKGIWKDNVIAESLGWIKEGLKERCITRDIKWGIKVPLKDFEDNVFYVWFDAPVGYISFTKELEKNLWEKDINNADNVRIYHFIGKDNIIFHTIFWPAMLLANGKFNLPYNVVGLQYLNYEGGKISKSQNRGIFCENLSYSGIESDVWRFYLTFLIPENSDSEWKWDEFLNKTNSELIGNFGNFVNRTVSFIQKNFNGKINFKDINFHLTSSGDVQNLCDFEHRNDEIEMLARVRKTAEEYKEAMINLRLRDGLRKILEISGIGNEYMQKKAPWKGLNENAAECKKTMYCCALICYYLANLSHPFLPDSSKKILEMLNLKTEYKFENLYKDRIEFEIKEVSPLFKKMDEKIIEEIKGKVTKIGVETKEGKKAEEKEEIKIEKEENKEITYEDFKKLNLRVGTIEQAEEIPKSDRLLKLTVNLGLEKRTILAGIKKFYKPSDLINKQVIVLTNLKPRKMLNIESQGMILAAEDDEGIKLLVPDKKAMEGSEIG